MKKLELNVEGLESLQKEDVESINGGLSIGAAILVGLVLSFVDNFGDFREGISDGFSGTPRH